MRSKKKTVLGVVMGGLLCLAAYMSADYLLSPAVMDSGGGKTASSSYGLDCSIGGPVIARVASGEATSANYTLEVGSVSVLTKGVQIQATPGGGGGGCVPCAGSAVSPAALPALLACLARRRRWG